MLRWDDGLQLAGGALWLDAPRRRGFCFVSHAGSGGDPALRTHRRTIATGTTLRLLDDSCPGGSDGTDRSLPTTYFRPFFLAGLELELLPAGLLPGSAQLLVTTPGGRLLYGAHVGRIGPNRSAEPLRVRRCEVLAMSCELGRPQLALPRREAVEAGLVDEVRDCLRRGRPPVLLAGRLGLAQEVARLLHEHGVAVRLHRVISRTAAVYARAGLELPGASYRGSLSEGEALLWPLELSDSPALARLRPRARLLAVHEQAALAPDRLRKRSGADLLVPLSLHASFDELLRYVQTAAARRVLLHGGATDEFGRILRELGYETERVGAPRQAELPS